MYENTLISLFQNDGNNEKERKVRERESTEQMNKEERRKEHSRDRGGEEVNDKRRKEREEKDMGGYTNMGEKYGMVMKKTEKYGDFSLQRKETFPVS